MYQRLIGDVGNIVKICKEDRNLSETSCRSVYRRGVIFCPRRIFIRAGRDALAPLEGGKGKSNNRILSLFIEGLPFLALLIQKDVCVRIVTKKNKKKKKEIKRICVDVMFDKQKPEDRINKTTEKTHRKI